MRLLFYVISSCAVLTAADAEWLRPQGPGDPLVWGRKDGLVFGLPSPGGLPGPRGLIRVGIFSKDHARAALVNFIAIEPVITGPGSAAAAWRSASSNRAASIRASAENASPSRLPLASPPHVASKS